MTNPTPGTQLDRVLNLMQDGQWRSPQEISQATGDGEHSVTSRIRDLRLPSYGGHQVESRKRNVTHQIWEYRLVTTAPNAAGNAAPANDVLSGSIPSSAPGAAFRPSAPWGIWPTVGTVITPPAATQQPVQTVQSGPPIKFLNMDTMQVELVGRTNCKVDSSHGFDRVVALDDSGNVQSNLVTTQNAL
jgi:hypothetical protein